MSNDEQIRNGSLAVLPLRGNHVMQPIRPEPKTFPPRDDLGHGNGADPWRFGVLLQVLKDVRKGLNDQLRFRISIGNKSLGQHRTREGKGNIEPRDNENILGDLREVALQRP